MLIFMFLCSNALTHHKSYMEWRSYRFEFFGKYVLLLFITGSMCGMCGDGDGDVTNDLRTREGDIVTSEAEVGNSWVVPGRDDV